MIFKTDEGTSLTDVLEDYLMGEGLDGIEILWKLQKLSK
jgi:hypothetical protein